MPRYNMPPGRATWVRVVAAVTAVALAVSLGYSALALVAAPGWVGWLLLVGAFGLLVGLLVRDSGER
ncbi:MAG TPA: hypothetical protein VE709_12285 [Pseudonocardiaceae bacterium]|jgi:hypothetical protein|nr:hypothetical protein [Pseudonocardiaceae bacterium]